MLGHLYASMIPHVKYCRHKEVMSAPLIMCCNGAEDRRRHSDYDMLQLKPQQNHMLQSFVWTILFVRQYFVWDLNCICSGGVQLVY